MTLLLLKVIGAAWTLGVLLTGAWVGLQVLYQWLDERAQIRNADVATVHQIAARLGDGAT